MTSPASIVWFRSDLRLVDNPALDAAHRRGGRVIPVFIWAPHEEGQWPPGPSSRWWLHHSLTSLAENLAKAGSRLIVREGRSLDTLLRLARETGATAVFWNRRYEPACMARDHEVARGLDASSIMHTDFNSTLLFEPRTISTQAGTPFQVFTAFWRACLSSPLPLAPSHPHTELRAPARWPDSLTIDDLGLVGRTSRTTKFASLWKPGANGANERLQAFLARTFSRYEESRNRPDITGTSRLSPHLHFGEISPRQVLYALQGHARKIGLPEPAWRNSQFLAELGWREFAHHLLYHYPHTPTAALRPAFRLFPWRTGGAGLEAWQTGHTGYPIVDAGMRELNQTGWMHNRVRMVVASFLVKDLLVTWTRGAEWFWETLVDADLANNTLGWQWSAGCGADAVPFFRVFNPTTQGAKFDPEGIYVKKWLPELARLDRRWIHCPWQAPKTELASARIVLGRDYPVPIVHHAIAREVAFEAYSRLRRAASNT